MGNPLYMRHQTSSWSSTEAVVTQSELDCYTYDGAQRCSVIIRADYTIGEQTHQARAILNIDASSRAPTSTLSPNQNHASGD